MSVTVSAVGRNGAGGSDLVSDLLSDLAAVLAAGAAAGGLSFAVGAPAIREPLNIGAGCWPVWNHKPFTRIAMVATAATPKAMASLWLHPNACSTNQRRSSSGPSAGFLLRAPLRTDLHPLVRRLPGGRRGRRGAGPAKRRNLGSLARPFAIDRQADGDAGPLPDPALDGDVAAMQRQQPLHDREAEPGAVVAAVVGGARLEERVADARQILGIDADAGVGDGDRDGAALVTRAHRHLAAAVGELDGVGYQVEHDLVERALVGHDVRHIVRQPRGELDVGFLRLK